MYSTAGSLAYSELRSAPRTPAARYGLILCAVSVCVWATGFVVGFIPALTVLVGAGFIAAVAGLIRPVLGLFGVGMLCTLDAISRFYVFEAGALPWNTFNYWLLLVGLLHVPLLLRFQPLPLQLLVLFLGVATLQLIYSEERMRGLQHLFGAVALFGLLAYFLRGVRKDSDWVWLALVNGTVAAVGGLVYYVSKAGLPEINPNAASYFPLTGLLSICLGFPFVRRYSVQQTALLFLAAACAGWVFLSGSRGSIFIAICCLLFLFHCMRGLTQRVTLVLAGLLFLGVISTRFGELKQYAMERIQKTFREGSTWGDRTSGRSEIVEVGWRIFLAHPLGVGTGNFRPYYAKYSSEGYIAFKPGLEVDAHAGWIKTLAENGIPGIFLFGAFVASFAYVGWCRRGAGLFPIGFLVTIVLAVAFLSTEFQGKALWFLVAGSLVLLSRRLKPAHRPEERDGRIDKVETGPAI